MVGKGLEVKVSVNVGSAQTALNGVSASLKNLDKSITGLQKAFGGINGNVDGAKSKMTGYETAVKGATSAHTNLGNSVKNSSAHLSTLGANATRAGGSLRSSFSGIGGIMSSIGSSIMGLGRNIMGFMGIVGGIGLVGAIRDLDTFSKSYGLLLATTYTKTIEGKNAIKKGLFEISSTTGENIESVTKSMTQLYSSGLTPTASEGTKEYIKQLNDVNKIQMIISKTAIGTGTQSDELGTAAIKFIAAFGGNVHNVDDWNEALNLMSATLDQGIGVMGEYINQFGKFGEFSKNAGFSKSDTLGMFARFTKTQSADTAGDYTKAISRFFSQGTKQAFNFENQLKRIKETTFAAFGGTAKEYEQIKKMTGADFANIMYDPKEKKQRGLTESLQEIQKITKGRSKGAINTFVTALSGGRSEVAMALSNLVGDAGFEDYVRMAEKMKEFEKTKADLKGKYNRGEISGDEYDKQVSLIDEKYSTMTQTFSVKRGMFLNNIRLKITEVSDAISPAIGVFLDMASEALSGNGYDTGKMASAFAETRENIKGMAPRLGVIVTKMEEAAKRLTDGRGDVFFKSASDAASGFLFILKSVMGGIADLGKFFNEIQTKGFGGAISGVWKQLGDEAKAKNIEYNRKNNLPDDYKRGVSTVGFGNGVSNIETEEQARARFIKEKFSGAGNVDFSGLRNLGQVNGISSFSLADTQRQTILLEGISKKPPAVTNVYLDGKLISTTTSQPGTSNVNLSTSPSGSKGSGFSPIQLGFSGFGNK